jgi:hypothetical protein
MSDSKNVISDLSTDVMDYVETWYKLTVVSGTRKATHTAASLLTIVSVVFLGIFVLFFGGLALGIWLGGVLNNEVAGYGLVAILFLVFMLILITLRKKIIFPFIRNLIIRKIYEKDDD